MVVEISSGRSSSFSIEQQVKSTNEKQVAEIAYLESQDRNVEIEHDISGDVMADGLRRGLKGRHFVLISLGSIIGPGCFWGLGYAIYLSGPLGSLLGFGIVGVVVWALMQSLGEVTTLFPIHGGFIEHCGRFVDPALAFAVAWLYYLMWSVFLASDWNSAVLVLRYWISEETIPSYAWALIFWVFFSAMTTLGVRVYGEIEYIFGMFKFISLAVLFFLSILANVGAFGNGYVGFRYWRAPDGPIIHGINGFGQVFVLAAAYYVGTEIVSLAAAESKNPQRDVPKGVNSIVYRILFVFVGMSFFQSLICPSSSPQLLNATSKVASSPFTIGFELAGWKSAGHFVNAIITVAFISAGNGVVYVQSRTLYSLAKTGRAPKFFAITTKRGVPWVAILFSNTWGFLSLMNRGLSAGQVFSYITSVGGSVAYIAWIAIIFTHLRVRSAAKRQGIEPNTFPFRAFGSIWIYRTNLAVNVFLLLIQGFVVFESPFDWRSFIASYITLPTFFLLFLGFKWYNKTKWVSLDEIDFSDRHQWVAENAAPKKERISFGRRLMKLVRS